MFTCKPKILEVELFHCPWHYTVNVIQLKSSLYIKKYEADNGIIAILKLL